MGARQSIGWLGLFGALWLSSAAAEVVPRRADPFPTEYAHLLVPLPYSYPGVGEGVFLLGNFSNLYQSTTDLLVMGVAGDAGGALLQVDEFPLIPRRLFAQLYLQEIDRAVVSHYGLRGMDTTDVDDFNLMEMSLAREQELQLTLTFWERRLNLLLSRYQGRFEVDAIRDSDGGIISDPINPFVMEEARTQLGLYWDATDHYLNPRQGYRLGLFYRDQPAKSLRDPDYYVLDYNLRWYLPTTDTDTLVLHYFQSDAHVRRIGDVDPTNIRLELQMNCGVDPLCLQTEQELVDNLINQRTHGSARSLGGNERLRAYPMGRYQGGHTAFVGAEYRALLRQDIAPFDYFIWKDVRSDIQLAFFAEWATVSESSGSLWAEKRANVGAGIRLVSDSGSVYRADLAYGEEGAELVVFFFYPWES